MVDSQPHFANDEKTETSLLFECQDLTKAIPIEKPAEIIQYGKCFRKDSKNLIIGYPGSGKSTQMAIWATQLDKENKPFLYLISSGDCLRFDNKMLSLNPPLVSVMLYEKFKQNVLPSCKTKQSALLEIHDNMHIDSLCKMLAYAIEQDYHIFIDEIPQLTEQSNIFKSFLNSMVQIELALKTTICSRFIGTETIQ